MNHADLPAPDGMGSAAAASDLAPASPPLGELLRTHAATPLDDRQIAQIVAHQQRSGLRFGEAAVALSLATREQVVEALSEQFAYPCGAPPDANRWPQELVLANSPFCTQAEVLRDLRSQLLADVLAPQQPRRSLAVLGTDRQDGRTYLCANLAVAFSQLGMRTLVVDADLRAPRMHGLFQSSGGNGLSQLLGARAPHDPVRPVEGLPHLFLLQAGAQPPNPLELLHRADLAGLLAQLEHRFDVVLLDTPASALGADAVVLAQACGASLLVGRRNHSRWRPMQQLVERLARSQVRNAGVVLNEH